MTAKAREFIVWWAQDTFEILFIEFPRLVRQVVDHLLYLIRTLLRVTWWLCKWSVIAVVVLGAGILLFGPILNRIVVLPVWGLALIVWVVAMANAQDRR